MEKWIAIAVKDDKYAIPLEDENSESPATFDSLGQLEACWNEHPFSGMYSGWALDIINGTTEPL